MSVADTALSCVSPAALERGDITALLAPQPLVADELAARVSQAQALAELGEIAAHAEDPDGLLRVAVHIVARGLDAALVSVVEPESCGTQRVRASTARELVGTAVEPRGSLAAEVLETGAPATSHAPPAAPGLRAASALASGVAVPLAGARHTIGVLWACDGRDAFDAAEIQFMQVAANMLGGYLARHDAMREMQMMQARLALADRLFASARVAAGLAHEINNPLAVVTSNLAWVEESIGEIPAQAPLPSNLRREVGEALSDARRSAERMRDLIRDLRALNRVDESDLSAVPVGPLIRACARIVSAEIAGRARLVLDLDGSPSVHGNEARLGQVFLNLLVNAAHAIAPGAPDANEIRVTARAHGGAVAVEVRDSGRGIARDELDRLFEPFFTTSPARGAPRGRGLGLAICHQIVTSIGGSIGVESIPGEGATFRVLLRIAPAEAPPGHLAQLVP